MVAKTKSNLKPADEPTLPFEISGSDDDEVYNSVVNGMQILHDRYVKDNLRQFVQDQNRHKQYKLLPFWLVGWGEAHRFLEPIRTYAEERVKTLLDKELEDMKVKAAYIRGVRAFIRALYLLYGNGYGKTELKDVTRDNLSNVIGMACAAERFYDVYDANIHELLAWDDQARNRLVEQAKNRLSKLL